MNQSFKFKSANIAINNTLYSLVLILLLIINYFHSIRSEIGSNVLLINSLYIIIFVSIWYFFSRILNHPMNGKIIKIQDHLLIIGKEKYEIADISLIKLRFNIYTLKEGINEKGHALVIISAKDNKKLFKALQSILVEESQKLINPGSKDNYVTIMDKVQCFFISFIIIEFYFW